MLLFVIAISPIHVLNHLNTVTALPSLLFCSEKKKCKSWMTTINEGGAKVAGIRQIVRLKEYLQKWQSAALGPIKDGCSNNNNRSCNNGISPEINRRLRTMSSAHESDDDSCHSPEPSHGVPKGYLAVYVGPELRRFVIPTSYLGDPLFKVLLEKVEEEFVFDHGGALTIPCEVETFKYLLHCMENHQRDQRGDHIVNNGG